VPHQTPYRFGFVFDGSQCEALVNRAGATRRQETHDGDILGTGDGCPHKPQPLNSAGRCDGPEQAQIVAISTVDSFTDGHEANYMMVSIEAAGKGRTLEAGFNAVGVRCNHSLHESIRLESQTDVVHQYEVLVVIVRTFAQQDKILCGGNLVRLGRRAAAAAVFSIATEAKKAEGNQESEYANGLGRSGESHTLASVPPAFVKGANLQPRSAGGRQAVLAADGDPSNVTWPFSKRVS